MKSHYCLATVVALLLGRTSHAGGAPAATVPAVDPPAARLSPAQETGPLPADGYYEAVERVAAGVWLIRQEKPFHLQPIGNVSLIEQADGLVLVDSGGSPGSGRRIARLVRQLSPKPVKAIVITHWHGDHPLGLAAILEQWPSARVISTEATHAHLGNPVTMNTPARIDAEANRKIVQGLTEVTEYARQQTAGADHDWQRDGWRALERLFFQYASDMDGALTLQPTETFRDRLELPDAENPAEALFLGRANTDGDALVWLPKARVLITGDIVVAPVPFGFRSYPREWIEVLKRLETFDFDVLVPGHGAAQRDRAYVERLIALLEEVRAQVGALVAEGVSHEELRARIALDSQAAGFVGEDAWLRQWFATYWTDPILASAEREARGEPIVQSLAD